MIYIIFIAVFSILLLLLDLLYIKNWKKGLEVGIVFEDDCLTEGDEGRIIETIVNDKNIPLPGAMISFEMDKSITYEERKNILVSDKIYRHDCTNIDSKSITERSFKVRYGHRGYYSIDGAEVRMYGITGNNKDIARFSFFSDVYVYPSRSVHVDAIALLTKITGEILKQRTFIEDPFEFKGIRDYTGTEPMNKINWAASAKEGHLMVNNYYDTTGKSVKMILDMTINNLWKENSKLEEIIRIARKYMENFVKNRIPVNIITNALASDGSRIKFEVGLGNSFINDSLKKMSRIDLGMKPENMADMLGNMKAGRNELTILLSPNSSSILADAFNNYLGNEQGEWILPIMGENKPGVKNGKYNLTYVEVIR